MYSIKYSEYDIAYYYLLCYGLLRKTIKYIIMAKSVYFGILQASVVLTVKSEID